MSSLSLNTMDKYFWNTGRVAAGHVVCTGVLPELEHSALAVGASRDDAHWQHKRRHTRVQKQRASSVLLRFPASRLIRRNIGRGKRVEGMAAGAVCTSDCGLSGDGKGRQEWCPLLVPSAGFSIATMMRAASMSFSQVLARLITYSPSARRFQMYGI